VPAHGADDGEAGAGVAARQLDNGLPGPKLAGCMGIVDDLPRDPILLREPGIEVFELGEDAPASPRAQPDEFDDRRPADDIDYRRRDRLGTGRSRGVRS
jgi:hypothetical protein